MATWRDYLTATDTGSPYGVVAVKGASGTAELLSPVVTEKPTVSTRDMSATCVLTTPAPDRQGDIVVPSGADFSEHRINPVVLFHHGKGQNGHLPIGKAEDRSGNYTVRLLKGQDGRDRLVGTTYFSQSNRFANDVFGLVAEDILRGVSVGFDPRDDGPRNQKAVEVLGDSPTLDRPALKFNRWTLLEYSHTPIGVNREALTVAVNKSLDGSRVMHPSLLKYLRPYASPRKTVVAVGGALPRVEKAMFPPDDDDQMDAMDSAPGDTGVADDVPAEDAGTETDQTGPEPTQSVKALMDLSQGLLDACDQVEASMAGGEHIKARKKSAKFCADLKRVAAEIAAFAESTHNEIQGASDYGPDLQGDDAPEPDADEVAPSDEEAAEGDEEPDGDDGMDGVEPSIDDGDGDEVPKALKKGMKGVKKSFDLEVDVETGAIVVKGMNYTPRRLVAADLTGDAPVVYRTTPAPARKTDPAPKQTKAQPTGVPDGMEVVDSNDLAKLINELKNYRADEEAAERRASRR